MTKKHLLGLSVASGLLLVLAWPGIANLSFLLLFAFMPLLAVEDYFFRKGGRTSKMRWYAYLTFWIWNAGTTWWLFFVDEPMGTRLMSVVPAVFINALFFTIVFQLFHATRKRLGSSRGHASLVLYWLAFEFIHHRWDLGWPWLSVGNGFADSVAFVQWYEYTGISGGTFWVLLFNILGFRLFTLYRDGADARTKRILSGGLGLLLLVPTTWSIWRYSTYEPAGPQYEVVSVQPNIDPYYEKYKMPLEEQLAKMLALADEAATPETDFFIFPETAIPGNFQEWRVETQPSYKMLMQLLAKYPKARILIGISSIQLFEPADDIPHTATQSQSGKYWIDHYNAALQLDASGSYEIYHKSKLVLGVETMPFSWLTSAAEALALDFGGIVGSLGTQTERVAFAHSNGNGPKVAPIICYESVYGEYVSQYTDKGAELLFVITNDAWWDNTPGHKQHLTFSRLRAIEQRRSVARSANTGISCFIDAKGNISQATNYWEPAAINGKVTALQARTFYARHGDYLSRAALFFSVLLLIWTVVKSISKKQIGR